MGAIGVGVIEAAPSLGDDARQADNMAAAAAFVEQSSLVQQEAAQADTRVFVYPHADGTVHRGSVEEMKKGGCPMANLPPSALEMMMDFQSDGQEELERQGADKAAAEQQKPGKSEPTRTKKPGPVKVREKLAAEEEPAVRQPVPEAVRQAAATAPEQVPQPPKAEAKPVIPPPAKQLLETTTPQTHNRPPAAVAAEALAPKPLEPQLFERIFPEEIAAQQDALSHAAEPAGSLTEEASAVLPEATSSAMADEQAPQWEEADLSAEVAVVPTPEAAELPAEDVIHSFTEALAKVVPPAEEDPGADVIAQSREHSEHAEDIAPAEPILQEVAAKIDQIEPEAQQEAAKIILNISEAVQKLANLPPVALEATLQQAEEELAELCRQLLVVIGHKADEQAVKDFVRIVRKMLLPMSGEPQTAEFVDYMHERKPGLLELPAPNWFASALSTSPTQSAAFGYLALGRASRAWVLRS